MTRAQHKPRTQLFSRHLYAEGLRRLRVPALAVGILAVTLSVLIPLIFWFSLASDYGTPNYYRYHISHLLTAPVLPAMMAAAPIFMIAVFSFQFRRRDSDFYHALPYTRPCLFVSFAAAALSLLFALEALSGGLSLLIWALCPHVTLVASDIFPTVGAVWLGTLVTAGVAAIVLSLAGTGLTALYQFCNLALTPRLFLFLIERSLNTLDGGAWISWDSASFPTKFLAFEWSAPYGVFWEWVSHSTRLCAVPQCFKPGNILYNLAVALILLGVAAYLFSRRKSEVAGHSAPGRGLQVFFRILAAMPLGLVTAWVLAEIGLSYGYVLIPAVLCLLVYLLYELLTTKRGKNMLRALPWTGVLAGICLLPILIGAASNSIALKAARDADRVQSIQILYDDMDRIEDPELIQLLHTAATQRPEGEDGTSLNICIHYKGGYSVTHMRVPLQAAEWERLRSDPDLSVPPAKPLETAVPEAAIAATEPELLP